MTAATSPESSLPPWRARAVLLAVIGAVAAWLVWWIMDLDAPRYTYLGQAIDPARQAGRAATAAAVSVTAIAFGFGLERIRIRWTTIFAVALGVIAGLIVWWNNQLSVWNWSGASLFLAIAIALPLFQVVRDEGRWSLPYAQVHGHAWTNVVLWGACWGFAFLSMLLIVLLSELFRLIGIQFLFDLIQHHGWFPALVIGGAFGAALGMLRDMDNVVRLLQRVVTTVLSILAPVLAIALILFLVSLPFTGLSPLWEATKNTTPTLMACVIGALVLANAVIGPGESEEARSPVLRWSAVGLGITVLPLAVVAAIAMGMRLAQHGLTPDRLWGLTCAVFAVAYGLVYLVAAVRGRLGWAPLVRRDNIRLAIATMVAALMLATPIVGFNALSANDQVTRLQAGKVKPADFDWAALAFDFGQPGRQALAKLQKSADKAIADQATTAMTAQHRWDLASFGPTNPAPRTFDIKPAGAALPDALRSAMLADTGGCWGSNYCRVYLQPGGKAAIVIGDGCMALPPDKRTAPGVSCAISPAVFVLRNGRWVDSDAYEPWTEPKLTDAEQAAALKRERDAIDSGKVEIRPVTRQQLFIGDKPVGQPFDQP